MREYRNRLLVQIIGWICALFVIALNVWLVVDAILNNFSTSSPIIWIIIALCALLFLALLAYISFCKIEPKESYFELIPSNAPSIESVVPTLQEIAISGTEMEDITNDLTQKENTPEA
jgi:uncharacterized membrane protein YuzA (DUF378 family)